MGKKQKREKIQWFERNSSRQVGQRFFRYRAGVYFSAVSTAATQALVGISGIAKLVILQKNLQQKRQKRHLG